MKLVTRLWVFEGSVVAITLLAGSVFGYLSSLSPLFFYGICVLIVGGYSAQFLIVALLTNKNDSSKFEIFVVSPLARYLLNIFRKKTKSISSLELRVKKLEDRAKRRKEKMVTTARGFRDSLSALPDPLVVLDQNNRMEWWNRAAGDMFELSNSDEKKRVEVIIGSEQFRRYAAQSSIQGAIEVVSPAVADVLLSVQITPFGDGQKLLQARDVTRVRQLEKVRQDFVANASHELRTPLTVVHGYLESLMDSKIEEGALLSSLLNRMYQQTTRIKGIVEDMLTLSRLEQELGPDPQSIDMIELLESVRQEAVVLSGEKCHNITLQAERGYMLKSNPEDIRSLVSNLTSNAIRYTAPHGKIGLNWRVDRKGAFFSVTDTGIGIEPTHIARITERFYRVDVARSRESGGTGLGLAIVKHVLSRIGGELSIISKPDIGSTFTCFFPHDLVYRSVERQNVERSASL